MKAVRKKGLLCCNECYLHEKTGSTSKFGIWKGVLNMTRVRVKKRVSVPQSEAHIENKRNKITWRVNTSRLPLKTAYFIHC